MSNKQVHDFSNATTYDQISEKGDFEIIASTGDGAVNVTIANLAQFSRQYDNAGTVIDLGEKVVDIDTRLATSKISLGTSTIIEGDDDLVITPAAGKGFKIGDKVPVYESDLAVFDQLTTTTVRRTEAANEKIIMADGEVSVFAKGYEVLEVISQGTTQSSVVNVRGDITSTSGTIQGSKIKANSGDNGYKFTGSYAGITSPSTTQLELQNDPTGVVVLFHPRTGYCGEAVFKGAGFFASLNPRLLLQSRAAHGVAPAVIQWSADTNNPDNSNYRIATISAQEQDSYKVLDLGVEGTTGIVVKSFATNNAVGQVDIEAPGNGVRFGETTDLHIDSARHIHWRVADTTQNGLMSASHCTDLLNLKSQVKTLQNNNGTLTQNNGFRQIIVDGGTDTVESTGDDSQLRFAGGDGIQISLGDGSATSVPDLTFAVASDVVRTGAAQTLTDKTLTSPDINGGTIDDAVVQPGSTGTVDANKLLGQTVYQASPPTDEQILRYSAANSRWEVVSQPTASATPTFPDGTVAAPGLAFDNGTDAGLAYDASQEELLLVTSGTLVAKAQSDQFQALKPIAADKFRVAGATQEIIGDNTRREIQMVCGQQTVATFDPKKLNLNKGLSLGLTYFEKNATLTEDDMVVLGKTGISLTLPDARLNPGQVLIIGPDGNSSASQIAIYGMTVSGTRQAVDGSVDGIQINGNESAMLVSAAGRWLRIGLAAPTTTLRQPTRKTSGTVGSTPVANVDWDSIAIDLNPWTSENAFQSSVYTKLFGHQFAGRHVVKSVKNHAILDANTQKATGVELDVIQGSAGMWQLSAPIAPLRQYFHSSQRNGKFPSFYLTLSGMPAGQYELYVLGGAHGHGNQAVQVAVVDGNGTSTADYAVIDDMVGKSVELPSGRRLPVIAGTGWSNSRGVYSVTDAINNAQWVEGHHYAKTVFNLGQTTDVSFVPFAVPFGYGVLNAIYLRRISGNTSTTQPSTL